MKKCEESVAQLLSSEIAFWSPCKIEADRVDDHAGAFIAVQSASACVDASPLGELQLMWFDGAAAARAGKLAITPLQ